jgi:ASCH domain
MAVKLIMNITKTNVDFTMKALSIRQPWAWLIINGFKDIENRSWPTKFRGKIYVHAGKVITDEEYLDAFLVAQKNGVMLPLGHELERGGIVGEVEIVDCVNGSKSPWFFGEYGFVLREAKPIPFQPCKGALGFFSPVNAEPIRAGVDSETN